MQVDRTEMRPLHEQIFLAREHARLTPQELEDKTGVSRQAINQYESGACKPSSEVLRRLSAALGTTLIPLAVKTKAATRKPAPKSQANGAARPGKRLSLAEARALHPVAEPKKKGWPTLAEIAAGRAQVRSGDAAMECGAYVRLFELERVGARGDLIEYALKIGTSRPVEAEDVLLALRTHLGDPRDYLDALDSIGDARTKER